MNYVPGTASLIDDIDSKLQMRVERAVVSLKTLSRCGIVSDSN